MLIFIYFEFKAAFGNEYLPGSEFMILSLFVFILFNNFVSLFPYIFPRSSHLVFTIGLAIPL